MNIVVGNAWPYANGKLHLGRIAVLLPGDIIARYHRMMGDNVVFVSGSDAHGRPVKLKALELGITPEDTLKKYNKEFIECFNKLNFSFDLFTNTDTEYHKENVKKYIEELYKKGYIYEETDESGEKNLIFSLSEVENDVKRIFIRQDDWRKNAEVITRRYLDEGLRDRAVTKEIDWGVDVPFEGFSNKKIFVWIEALMGYLTATSKCIENNFDNELSNYFNDEDSKIYLVHGKDNIPFHTIIFPGILVALGFKNPNITIVSSEHLKLEGKDFSTNKNWAIWVDEVLKKYNVDSLRYYLINNGPEENITDFKWRDFINSNNNDLVSELDSLYKKVVKINDFSHVDNTEKDKILDLYFTIGEKIEQCKFKSAIRQIFAYIKEENKKKNPKIETIINLANLLIPFLPETSNKIKETFKIQGGEWNFISINKPVNKTVYKPLFELIDRKNIIDEINNLKENKL
ncbi:class I tRNA ligase family protein [Clostridium sp. Ade.TY]|uniref:methionine--tRNA ligase n=1 Tax=Clostridium sp. Ade.TY TaxID=1391647 RepID=UPI0004155C0E|nr:class I tRNA ligase family protein [Clostridium sp. Ade.TY]